MTSKEKVLAWLNEQFVSDSIEVVDFPALPGGTIVRDQEGGEMLVFFDALTGQVKYFERADK